MIEINLIHYTKLKERLPFILDQFKNLEFKIKIIREFDKEDITKQEFSKFDTDYLSKGEISCFLKHLKVYNDLVDSKCDYSVVIEDDILLNKNFSKKLSKLTKNLPKNFDFVFFGASKLNMHIPVYKRRPYKNFYKKTNFPTEWGGNGISKTTDSYVVSRKGAKQIIEWANNCKQLDDALDFWLNQSARRLDLIGYWHEPTLTRHNSKFESNLASQYNNVISKN